MAKQRGTRRGEGCGQDVVFQLTKTGEDAQYKVALPCRDRDGESTCRGALKEKQMETDAVRLIGTRQRRLRVNSKFINAPEESLAGRSVIYWTSVELFSRA